MCRSDTGEALISLVVYNEIARAIHLNIKRGRLYPQIKKITCLVWCGTVWDMRAYNDVIDTIKLNTQLCFYVVITFYMIQTRYGHC